MAMFYLCSLTLPSGNTSYMRPHHTCTYYVHQSDWVAHFFHKTSEQNGSRRKVLLVAASVCR